MPKVKIIPLSPAMQKKMAKIAKANVAMIEKKQKASAKAIAASIDIAKKTKVKAARTVSVSPLKLKIKGPSLISQIEQLGCAVGDYKGKPTLCLDPEREPLFLRFQFGPAKAKLIVENIEAIKLFIRVCENQGF